jgi:uncharacterized protein
MDRVQGVIAAMRMLTKWLIGISAIAVLGGCAAITGLQNEFVFPNSAEGPMDRPPPPGAIQHWVKAADGSKVEGWLFLPKSASAGKKVPAVIFFHGNSDYIETKLEYPDFYTAHGMACLMVEYRGYRRSTGTPGEAAFAADADAFYDWLAARPDIDAARIGVHGHSMGAAIAAGLANRRPVHSLVMVSPFVSIPSMLSRYFVPGFLAREKFDNEAAVRAYKGPILMVHGANDEIVPHSQAVRLAKSGGENLRFVTVTPDDHDVPWDWKTFGKTLLDFYSQHDMSPDEGVEPVGRPSTR